MVKKEINYVRGKNRPGIKMKPKYVVMHNTANTNPSAGARAHRNYAQNNDRKASFHWAVDDKIAVAIIPEDEIAWHAGDGRNGNGNRHGIAIEMCENGDWDKTYKNTVKLAADRLISNNLPITALKGHRDFSNKNCPRKLIPIWDKFVADVNKELGKDFKSSTPSKNTSRTKNIKVGDKVKLKSTASNYATGQAIPSKYKGEKYTIQQVKSDKVLLKELYSWVFIKDLEGRSNEIKQNNIKLGSKVKIKQGAKSYDGVSLASFVYKKTYRVDQLKGNRALLDKNGICTPVNIKDLILV